MPIAYIISGEGRIAFSPSVFRESGSLRYCPVSMYGGEPVVQGGEPDPRFRGQMFGPLVAVEAQHGVVGKVGAELQEERPEIGVHAVEVEVVDQPGGLHDPRIGIAVGVAAFLGAEQGGFLLCPPDEHDTLGGGEVLSCSRIT